MNYDYSKLYGKIRERYGSQKAFAEALSMGEATLSLKLNNKSEWTQEEMTNALHLLGIPHALVADIFFTRLV